MPSALNDGNAWFQCLLLVWVEAPRWQPQHLTSLICLFLWPPALPSAMALWAPLSKTKALCQTGPCSHVSSCLTSKEWLVTNMQGRICSRYSKSQQTITCFFVFRGREKIAQVLSGEAVRLLSAPLDGAAESRPRCASLCWSPSSASTLLLLLWQQLAHIITHTAINVLAQTKPSSLCVSHKIASPPSRQRETTVIYTQLKYCVFYLFIFLE